MQVIVIDGEVGRARSWNLRARPLTEARQARSKGRSYRTPDPARKSAHKRSTRSSTGCLVDDETANPKVSQVTGNYNRIARDLDRALRAGRFTTVQRALIDEAREASWSFAPRDPRPFALNFSAIARNLRFERMGLSRQFRRLVADRVFVDLDDGRYLINKDYRQWLDGGRPRLSPEQVRWCLRIKAKGRTEHAGTHPPEHAGTQSPTDYAHPGPESLVVPPDPRIGTRPRAGARVFLESKRESSLEGGEGTPPRESTPSSPQRSPEDRALVLEAERLLRSDLRTEAIALELGRTHNGSGMIEVPAWKFLRAAQRLLSPEVLDAKRGRWSYFLGIVKGLTDAERDEPASKSSAPRETPAQRKRREFLEGIERMKAKEKAEREANHGQA